MNVQNMLDNQVFAQYNKFASTPLFRICVCVFMCVSVIVMAIVNSYKPEFNLAGYNIFWIGGSFIVGILYLTNFWRYGINLNTCKLNLLEMVEYRCKKNEKLNTPLRETFLNVTTFIMMFPIVYIGMNELLFALLIGLVFALEAGLLAMFYAEYKAKVVYFARNLTEFEKAVEQDDLEDDFLLMDEAGELAENVVGAVADGVVKGTVAVGKLAGDVLSD